jgi:hypothetical protein
LTPLARPTHPLLTVNTCAGVVSRLHSRCVHPHSKQCSPYGAAAVAERLQPHSRWAWARDPHSAGLLSNRRRSLGLLVDSGRPCGLCPAQLQPTPQRGGLMSRRHAAFIPVPSCTRDALGVRLLGPWQRNLVGVCAGEPPPYKAAPSCHTSSTCAARGPPPPSIGINVQCAFGGTGWAGGCNASARFLVSFVSNTIETN